MCCFFEGSIKVFNLFGFKVVPLLNQYKKVTQARAIQDYFHDLSKGEGSELTHILGSTKNTEY